MKLVIENSGLLPTDLGDPVHSAYQQPAGASGYRGVTSDIISGAAEGSTGAAVGALITALLLGWRKLRDRQLKDPDPVAITVEIRDASDRATSVRIMLSPNPDPAHTVETAIDVAGLDDIAHIHIKFAD